MLASFRRLQPLLPRLVVDGTFLRGIVVLRRGRHASKKDSKEVRRDASILFPPLLHHSSISKLHWLARMEAPEVQCGSAGVPLGLRHPADPACTLPEAANC